MELKEYKIGEAFKHTDGRVYRCVKGETCEGCAFRCAGNDCGGPYCDGRSDGRSVKFIAVTKPSDGMLFRAGNGRMYRLTQGSHWKHQCACDDDNSLSCGALDTIVFGCAYSGWHWSLVEEDVLVEPPKPPEPPKRHIELAVVKVEDDNVTFRIVEQTHRCGEFSQQANTDEFKACNGITLASCAFPYGDGGKSTLFCQGYRDDRDNIKLTCTTVGFARVCVAVAEYNATDGRGHEKPWPSVGDKYFCIAAEGKVDRLTFNGYEFDRKMQDFGNFFRTESEAKAALERVKQALKGDDDLR